MAKPNFIESIRNFFRKIFKKKPKKRKGKKPGRKSKGITIIPDGLVEITKPLTRDFDKEKFYKYLRKKFPKHYKTIYKMMALETRHFKSGQFINTFSAGMEVHKEAFPFGWTLARRIWQDDKLKPFGYRIFTDAAKRKRAFLAFKSPSSFATLLNAYLNKYRPGRWRSTQAKKAAEYEAVLKKIRLPKV